MIDRTPQSDEIGLIVRPVFSGSQPGILTVKIFSGSIISTITEQPSSASLIVMPASITTVTLVEANTDRLGLTITNNSESELFIRSGPGALTTAYAIRMKSYDLYEFPFPTYTGMVTGIWKDITSGSAMIQESTR